MKRLVFLILALLLLWGCAAPPEGTHPTTVPQTTQPHWGYPGNLKGYTYYYEDGRDRQWEEDVLYVAEVYLGEVFANGHPLLTDMDFTVFYSQDGMPVEYKNYYNEALRTAFIQDFEAIIPQISQLEDYEILFAMEQAVAKLQDLHSSIGVTAQAYYPLGVVPIYRDGKAEYYVDYLPKAQEGLMFSRLVAVNDVPVAQLHEKLRGLVSYENDAAYDWQFADMLALGETMAILGVTQTPDSAADFTFEMEDGSWQTVTFPCENARENGYSQPMVLKRLDYDKGKGWEKSYFWEYLPEQETVYIRINRVQQDADLVYGSFTKQIRTFIQENPQVEKVVVDLKGNGGGQFDANLSLNIASILDLAPEGGAYVLFDGSSYSAAIILSSDLSRLSEKAVLVGEPGGQPANFFASVHSYKMPNSGYSFTMSDCFWISDAENTQPALMPDIVRYQTIADYRNGVDTALQWIFEQ